MNPTGVARGAPEGIHLIDGAAAGATPGPLMITVPVPSGFAYEAELIRLARLAAELLAAGMPERELARRLARYHPAQEGI